VFEIEIKEANGRSNEIWFKRAFISILHYNTGISNAYERCKSKGDVINSENFGVQVVIPIILLVEVPIAAVAMGATIIETLTLDRTWDQTDHGFIRARGIKSNG
jgi:hypothetical protein